MTFDEIWGQLLRKDPKLNNEDYRVELTAPNLKRLLQQVHDQGVKEGNKNLSVEGILDWMKH